MSSWLISIAGVVFVGVILEVILPSNRTSVFIKSIFSLFILYIIVLPIPQIINIDSKLTSNNIAPIDMNFIINNNLNKISSLEDDIINTLEEMGIGKVSIIISANIYSDNFKVQKVYVDLYNVVLKQQDKHIYSIKDITYVVEEKANINKENIVVYGQDRLNQ